MAKNHRRLEDEGDDTASSYLVNSKGEAYEPYSLAWRYLGMYVDCDLPDSPEEGSSGSVYEDVNRRRLASGDNEENDCSRKVLWAAYHDPGYKDGSIGEYQFYDWQKGVWDKSTCQTKRCARMDCHEPSTHFKLVGVFKETDGLVDWAEQLFKHQGYCLWADLEAESDEKDGGSGDSKDGDDNDTFDSMDGFRQYWPSECTQMYLTDYDGNTLYIEAKPQKAGNMTYGIYLDEDCSQEATMTYPQYTKKYFETYYGYDETESLKAAAYWSAKFADWNHWMTSYKVCNPCRAYSRIKSSSNNDNDNEKRFLNEDNGGEDGDGDEEQWGYNCYDYAGYTNCNQCYKFETKTDLEEATVEDLERASLQGTILAIKYLDGKVYGEGYISNTPSPAKTVTRAFTVLGAIALLAVLLYMKRAWIGEIVSGRKREIDALAKTFGEGLYKGADNETATSEDFDCQVRSQDKNQETERELEDLKHQISRERVQHQLERMRKEEYIKQLEKRIGSKELLEEAVKEANLSHSS